jgi:hypothetical protein
MKCIIVRKELYLKKDFRSYIYTKYGKGEKRHTGFLEKALVKVNRLIRHRRRGLRVVG